MPALSERSVEHLAGRPDEGAAGKVLLIARLLADQHQRRIGRAFAEHGLGRILVEMAAGAIARLCGERLQRALGIVDPLFLAKSGRSASGPSRRHLRMQHLFRYIRAGLACRVHGWRTDDNSPDCPRYNSLIRAYKHVWRSPI